MGIKHWRRNCTDPAAGLMAYLLLALVRCLTYRSLARCAQLLSLPVVGLYASGRKLVVANLEVAFPDWTPERRHRATGAVMKNAILGSLEFFWFAGRPQRVKEFIDVSDADVQDALEEGRSGAGLLLLSPHLGNWELMGQALAAHGLPVCAVAHAIRNKWVARIVSRTRGHHGMTILSEGGAVRAMLASLRAGKVVGVLMDQNTRPNEGGVFVDFMGLPAPSSRAPAALARRLGIPVRVVVCVREEDRLRVHVAKLPRPTTAYESDAELTAAMLAGCEDMIRRWPEQYAWLYARWRYIPRDVPDSVRERYPYYAKTCTPDMDAPSSDE